MSHRIRQVAPAPGRLAAVGAKRAALRSYGRGWRTLLAILFGSIAAAPATLIAQVAPTPEAHAARVRSLDCDRVSAGDVAQVLAREPAPRIIALQGSVAFVTMAPFADFLEAMGYPADRLADPRDGSRSRSSFVDSARLAGEIAWYFENEGRMPILIGHSQGGMVVIRVLHELAGTFGRPVAVWPPGHDAPENRTTVVDRATGKSRPVSSLRVGYATALATGSLPRLLLGQWGILPLLRDVPDSVVDFTGFAIPWDPIAGTGAEPAGYHATGIARVRNVVLPVATSHIGLPRAAHLAAQPAVRAWIEAYVPGTTVSPPAGDLDNLLHAADIWYSVKRQWCVEARRNHSAEAGSGR